jgi:DNA-binding NtrC family response regulator
VNADREIIFVNGACELLLGRSADQLTGLTCRYHGPMGTMDLPDLGASIAPPPEVLGGVPGTARTLILRGDGSRLWRHIHFIPCQDTNRATVAVMGIVAEDNEILPPASTQAELHEGLLRLRNRLYRKFGLDRLIGSGDAMGRVLAQIRVAARSSSNVLIWGERGTGKEMVARTIHAESDSKSAPFLPVDCALLPPELAERDLFGRAGRYSDRGGDEGLLRCEHGATLLLKNVDSLSRDVQGKMWDLLNGPAAPARTQPGKAHHAVRLIGTATSNPAGWLHANGMRRDLFYSLTTMAIEIPSLRDRKEDIPLLAQAFVEDANVENKKQVSGLAADAIEVLLSYDWPGNVRELRGVIEQALATCPSSVITAEHLTARIQGAQGGAFAATEPAAPLDLDATLADTERRMIEQAIRRARGNKRLAAELLSITRPRLYRRMQMLGMDMGDDSSPGAD